MSGYETDHAALAATAGRVALADEIIASKTEPARRIGSGIIVGKRHKGRLILAPKPHEHVNREAAEAEALRLSKANPGTAFEVLMGVETYLADKVK